MHKRNIPRFIIYTIYVILISTLGYSCSNETQKLKTNKLPCYYGKRSIDIINSITKLDLSKFVGKEVGSFISELDFVPADTVFLIDPPQVVFLFNKDVELYVRLNSLQNPKLKLTYGLGYNAYKSWRILGFKLYACKERFYYPREANQIFYD